MSKDGTQLKTLYNKCNEIKNSILIIKDDNNCIFGSFISEQLTCKFNEFYGTAETFLLLFMILIKYTFIIQLGKMIIIYILMIKDYVLDVVIIYLVYVCKMTFI